MAMNNSLAEVHPELVSEWSEKNLPLTPDDITFGSNKKVWWKGTCGHEWQTSVKARSNGEKCPICSGARVIAGINDLATLEPLLAKQWSKKNTVDSIREYGVLVPAIARPDPEGGYELISGHRRKRGCEMAGLQTMPVIIRDLDDDAAVLVMVDSNIQREELLPSERAFAYR